MNAISDDVFLRWAAQAGLVPDPRYPMSRQQLVFERTPDCWYSWRAPDGLNEKRSFVAAALSALGSGAVRVRLRGGGGFRRLGGGLEQERKLDAVMAGLSIPEALGGALEFDQTEKRVLADLVLAFLSSGYRVETDLEIVSENRTACVMVNHHREVMVHFSENEARHAYVMAMSDAGYAVDSDEDKP